MQFRSFVEQSPTRTAFWDQAIVDMKDDGRRTYASAAGKRLFNTELDELPFADASLVDAMLFCNWLSVEDGFSPCYEIPDVDDVTTIIVDHSQNGYRLPTYLEWNAASKAVPQPSQILNAWTSEKVDEPRPVRRHPPNQNGLFDTYGNVCLLYTSPSPRDATLSRMPSSA